MSESPEDIESECDEEDFGESSPDEEEEHEKDEDDDSEADGL